MAWIRKPRGEAKPDDKPEAKNSDEGGSRIVNGIRVSEGVAIIRRGG